ncbi:hypothetical protein BD310DRAFT_340364 [Dichomitus squalens]|uniref:Secreted protein n=1 Tax=Dichomitus squalens TaxID=114155 RepID=A0A4Q9Q009_9APHY|nr:hypothetical protein BD310DRAFT_340364 [Dichomitus squalens]
MDVVAWAFWIRLGALVCDCSQDCTTAGKAPGSKQGNLCSIYRQCNLALAFPVGLCIPLCHLGNLMGTLHRPYVQRRFPHLDHRALPAVY